MGYIVAGLMEFHLQHPEIEIHLFELDENKLTPFQFDSDFIKYYQKSAYKKWDDFCKICCSINPDLLIVSGRSNQHYLKISKICKKNVLTVSIQDTQNDGSFRTLIKSLLGRVLYKQYFDCIWATGIGGVTMAKRLGYNENRIFKYCLTADNKNFEYVDQRNNINISRKIIFIGRFSVEKNINSLIQVFKKVNSQLQDKWELVLIGSGNLSAQELNYDFIKIHSFKSPNELKKMVSDADIFCLPSLYEPWGLVVHEMACMGKVLLISNRCGSISEFLIDGFNGLSFDPTNIEEFTSKMLTLFLMDSDEMNDMKRNSKIMSKRITVEMWAGQLFNLLNLQKFSQ
jgi:glycosyltransferase involved in cell wall biosynthesis